MGTLLRGSLLLTALLGLGCATPRQDVFRTDENKVQVDVLNLNWLDATLWVHREGERRRLGTVRGKGEGSFEIEWRGAYRMQIEIDLLAGDRCFTRQLSVDPGDRIYLELVENMRSEFRCRSR